MKRASACALNISDWQSVPQAWMTVFSSSGAFFQKMLLRLSDMHFLREDNAAYSSSLPRPSVILFSWVSSERVILPAPDKGLLLDAGFIQFLNRAVAEC